MPSPRRRPLPFITKVEVQGNSEKLHRKNLQDKKNLSTRLLLHHEVYEHIISQVPDC
jgi:hypothetical protein